MENCKDYTIIVFLDIAITMFLFKTHFRDWSLSPSSGVNYSVGPNQKS
jgi:hypothetical protein